MDKDMVAETSRLERRLASKAGYSLLEILIVISIIALLVTLVGPQVFKLFSGAQTKTAAAQMKTLKTAISTMHLDIGRYPTDSEGLSLLVQAPGEGVPNWNGPYLDGDLPKDPWGSDYMYVAPQGDDQPRIATFGEDKKEGGSGAKADIVL
jgi:general secretion pathway protein G